jgi:hypothetical protein
MDQHGWVYMNFWQRNKKQARRERERKVVLLLFLLMMMMMVVALRMQGELLEVGYLLLESGRAQGVMDVPRDGSATHKENNLGLDIDINIRYVNININMYINMYINIYINKYIYIQI